MSLLLVYIIRHVVSVSALTWFIRNIYYWNIQFLNNVIIIKTKVLLPQASMDMSDFDYSVFLLQKYVFLVIRVFNVY